MTVFGIKILCEFNVALVASLVRMKLKSKGW